MKGMLIKIFWSIWVLLLFILLATLATSVEITNRYVENGIICILIIGMIDIATIKFSLSQIGKLSLSAIVISIFLVLKMFTFWAEDWRTQTVLFQNKHLSNRVVEFQMQDKGSLGYNRRIVDRIKLFPFVSWATEVSQEEVMKIDTMMWSKVDIELNELGLRGG